MSDGPEILYIWVIYDHPTDLPDYYVARCWDGEKPLNLVWMTKDLQALRLMMMQQGLVKLARFPQDDPKIIECWI